MALWQGRKPCMFRDLKMIPGITGYGPEGTLYPRCELCFIAGSSPEHLAEVTMHCNKQPGMLHAAGEAEKRRTTTYTICPALLSSKISGI